MPGKQDKEEAVEQTIELRKEELRPQKEQVKAGEVGIRKEVVTERQTVDVPLSYEEVEVDYRPIEPRPADQPIGEGESLEVPVYEEQVTGVDKGTVVTGEISVRKRQAEGAKEVSGTVRREEPKIEQEGDLKVRGAERD